MNKGIALLLATALAMPALAQPKSGGSPSPQAETVHLYLKANGTETKGDPDAPKAAAEACGVSAAGRRSGALPPGGGVAETATDIKVKPLADRKGAKPPGGAAGLAIDEEGLHLHRTEGRARLSAAMTDVARRSGIAIDASRLEVVSTADGTLALAPTAAAVAGRVAAGDPVMLVWVSIPRVNGSGVTGFFQASLQIEDRAIRAADNACPRLPVSLQREIFWRLRDGGVGNSNARFVYRRLPAMPPPVLTPMDVENPPLMWPR